MGATGVAIFLPVGCPPNEHMNIKQLFDDDRAVSPVIGVILMVAITVILAAVIGTFVLGLGDRVSTSTPSASFSFDYSNQDPGNDTLEISHNGGDTIAGSELSVSVSGAADNASATDLTYEGDAFTGDVSAGTSYTLDNSSFNQTEYTDAQATLELDSATVRVIWSTDDGSSSSVLGTWNGPDA
jgi:flagellin-like protein